MPWDSSGRRAELPPDWDSLRNQALERDRFLCVWPGRWAPTTRQCKQPATDVDHVRRPVDGLDDHSLSNLQSLCSRHHQWKTNQESAAARREVQAKLQHPDPYPKHPGMK